MARVQLEHVTKIYPNGVRGASNLSLEVADGELLAIVGPSGSGKTTTLRLIAGLESVTSGTICIGGRVVNAIAPRDRDVAMVFQRPALYPHLNVRRNILFGLKLRRAARSRQEREAAVEEVARLLRIEHLLNRKPAELSGGERQRVALGRAIIRRPAVFLLDEPLSHLDFGLQTELRQELHLLQRRLRATMIYVTHDPQEATALGDRVAVLYEGAALQAGRPQELYERLRHRLVASLLSTPPMSFLDGTLLAKAGQLRLVAEDAELVVPSLQAEEWSKLAGKPVSLGFRPEAVCLAASRPGNPGSSASVRMTVRLIEMTAQSKLVTLECGKWQVRAAISHIMGLSDGDAREVTFDMQRAYVFDGETGLTLSQAVPSG